jgi:hypothetical protein
MLSIPTYKYSGTLGFPFPKDLLAPNPLLGELIDNYEAVLFRLLSTVMCLI